MKSFVPLEKEQQKHKLNESAISLENEQQKRNCRSFEKGTAKIKSVVPVEPQTCTHLPILPTTFSYSLLSFVIISSINLSNSLHYMSF